ncbi:hypothetical protein SNEBB_002826 [Seison nebaliae]|nr:hypothetical protein SNEBB_002826 [Seison nebaliae]
MVNNTNCPKLQATYNFYQCRPTVPLNEWNSTSIPFINYSRSELSEKIIRLKHDEDKQLNYMKSRSIAKPLFMESEYDEYGNEFECERYKKSNLPSHQLMEIVRLPKLQNDKCSRCENVVKLKNNISLHLIFKPSFPECKKLSILLINPLKLNEKNIEIKLDNIEICKRGNYIKHIQQRKTSNDISISVTFANNFISVLQFNLGKFSSLCGENECFVEVLKTTFQKNLNGTIRHWKEIDVSRHLLLLVTSRRKCETRLDKKKLFPRVENFPNIQNKVKEIVNSNCSSNLEIRLKLTHQAHFNVLQYCHILKKLKIGDILSNNWNGKEKYRSFINGMNEMKLEKQFGRTLKILFDTLPDIPPIDFSNKHFVPRLMNINEIFNRFNPNHKKITETPFFNSNLLEDDVNEMVVDQFLYQPKRTMKRSKEYIESQEKKIKVNNDSDSDCDNDNDKENSKSIHESEIILNDTIPSTINFNQIDDNQTINDFSSGEAEDEANDHRESKTKEMKNKNISPEIAEDVIVMDDLIENGNSENETESDLSDDDEEYFSYRFDNFFGKKQFEQEKMIFPEMIKDNINWTPISTDIQNGNLIILLKNGHLIQLDVNENRLIHCITRREDDGCTSNFSLRKVYYSNNHSHSVINVCRDFNSHYFQQIDLRVNSFKNCLSKFQNEFPHNFFVENATNNSDGLAVTSPDYIINQFNSPRHFIETYNYVKPNFSHYIDNVISSCESTFTIHPFDKNKRNSTKGFVLPISEEKISLKNKENLWRMRMLELKGSWNEYDFFKSIFKKKNRLYSSTLFNVNSFVGSYDHDSFLTSYDYLTNAHSLSNFQHLLTTNRFAIIIDERMANVPITKCNLEVNESIVSNLSSLTYDENYRCFYFDFMDSDFPSNVQRTIIKEDYINKSVIYQWSKMPYPISSINQFLQQLPNENDDKSINEHYPKDYVKSYLKKRWNYKSPFSVTGPYRPTCAINDLSDNELNDVRWRKYHSNRLFSLSNFLMKLEGKKEMLISYQLAQSGEIFYHITDIDSNDVGKKKEFCKDIQLFDLKLCQSKRLKDDKDPYYEKFLMEIWKNLEKEKMKNDENEKTTRLFRHHMKLSMDLLNNSHYYDHLSNIYFNKTINHIDTDQLFTEKLGFYQFFRNFRKRVVFRRDQYYTPVFHPIENTNLEELIAKADQSKDIDMYSENKKIISMSNNHHSNIGKKKEDINNFEKVDCPPIMKEEEAKVEDNSFVTCAFRKNFENKTFFSSSNYRAPLLEYREKELNKFNSEHSEESCFIQNWREIFRFKNELTGDKMLTKSDNIQSIAMSTKQIHNDLLQMYNYDFKDEKVLEKVQQFLNGKIIRLPILGEIVLVKNSRYLFDYIEKKRYLGHRSVGFHRMMKRCNGTLPEGNMRELSRNILVITNPVKWYIEKLLGDNGNVWLKSKNLEKQLSYNDICSSSNSRAMRLMRDKKLIDKFTDWRKFNGRDLSDEAQVNPTVILYKRTMEKFLEGGTCGDNSIKIKRLTYPVMSSFDNNDTILMMPLKERWKEKLTKKELLKIFNQLSAVAVTHYFLLGFANETRDDKINEKNKCFDSIYYTNSPYMFRHDILKYNINNCKKHYKVAQ